jgi:hypothetical protein
MHSCQYGKRDETRRKWIMNCSCNCITFLYITFKRFFVNFFCLYLIQIHISEPIGQHMTSPPPPHYVTFSAFLRPSTDIFPLPIDYRHAKPHSHVRFCVANTRVYLKPPSGRFSTCFVVSARLRVCLPPRRYIFRAFRSSLFTWALLL